MKDGSSVATRSSPVIAGIFRVCHITKRFRPRGEVGFTLVLAARTRRYVAIVGQSGSSVSVGDLVCVKGCILRLGRRPVFVASSLDRVDRSRSSVPRRRLVAAYLEDTVGDKSR